MPKNRAALPRGGRSPIARVGIKKMQFCWSTRFGVEILLINKIWTSNLVDQQTLIFFKIQFCWSTKFWYHFLLINKIVISLFVDQHFGTFGPSPLPWWSHIQTCRCAAPASCARSNVGWRLQAWMVSRPAFQWLWCHVSFNTNVRWTGNIRFPDLRVHNLCK